MQAGGALILVALGVGALWSWNIALGIIGALVLAVIVWAIVEAVGN